jgi:GNAT superfamily N-acetyltransferase
LAQIPRHNQLTQRMLRQRLQGKEYQIHIVECSGKKVGAYIWYQVSAEAMYLWLGILEETYRGRGITSLYLSLMLEWFRQKGYKKVVTKTHLHETRAANRLLRKFSFQVQKIDG